MARVRKLAMRSASRRAEPAAEVVVPWRRDGTVTRLTKEIFALEHSAGRSLADTVIKIGKRLRLVYERLPYGSWLEWVDEASPFSTRTAYNYIGLAEWSEGQALDFQRFKHLGPGKLYAIATLDESGRKVLRKRKYHSIPGTDKKKTVEVMSVAELNAVVLGLRERPNGRTVNRVVVAYRQRLAGLDGATDELLELQDEIELEQATEFHDKLVELAEAIERAFEL